MRPLCRAVSLALTCTCLAVPQPTAAGSAQSETELATRYDIPFEKYELGNGLEVILHKDSSLPLVAVNLWYHVGPANEPPQRSGFAHLFEHLMFEGSEHVGSRFDTLLESAGATNANGTTNWDRTNYFETVPSEYLELALWLESDRMGFMLETLTQERLDIQREVVKNERRQRHDNAPYGRSDLALFNALFPEPHPYHGAVIGSMEDLSRATLQDVREFFDAFYAPSNATLTLAGDFDVSTAKAWIQRYFGSLRRRPKPAGRSWVTPPLRVSVRREIDEPVTLARVAFGWITPPAYTADDATLDVTVQILAGGKASRLYRGLVVEQRVSPEVNAYLDSNQLASLFVIEALASAGTQPATLESALAATVAELARGGPTEQELARAKKAIRFNVLNSLQRLNGGSGESGRAGMLQRLNHYLGKPGNVGLYLNGIDKTTASDVRRALTSYAGTEQRVTIITRPIQRTDPTEPKDGAP